MTPRTLDPVVRRRSDARARWSAAMMNNFGTPAHRVGSGQGAIVVDADGKSYLDLLGGIAVNSLGHAHPAVVRAVSGRSPRSGTSPTSSPTRA